MILLTRLGGPVFALNPDLVERADCTPDTVITLVDGKKYVVAESLPEVITLIRQFRATVVADAQTLTTQAPARARSERIERPDRADRGEHHGRGEHHHARGEHHAVRAEPEAGAEHTHDESTDGARSNVVQLPRRER